MKSLRLVALSAFLTIGASSAVFYSSCSKDACKDVTCQNGGTCSGGNCTCPTGYEGTTCQTLANAKFVKIWSATDTKVGGSTLPTYSSNITVGSAANMIKISNFSALFIADVNATVAGNTITIATQTPDNDNYAVAGTGVLDATTNKITWTYSITSPTNAVINYTGIWN